MKQSLFNRIFIPLVIFSILSTITSISISIYFITDIFKSKETTLFSKSMDLLETNFNHIIYSNLLIQKQVNPQDDLAPQLSSYIFAKGSRNHFKTYNLNTLPMEYIPFLDKNTSQDSSMSIFSYQGKDGWNTVIFHHFKHDTTPKFIVFHLTDFIRSYPTSRPFFFGLIHTTQQIPIFSGTNGESKNKNLIIDIFQNTLTQKNLNKKIHESNMDILFKRLSANSDLMLFTYSKSQAYIYSLLKIIGGIVFFISLLSITIFFIFYSIIQRVTSSIEIIQQSSKKVSQGDFNQKVYLPYNDEIGDLSKSFNLMVEHLKESTATVTKQRDQLQSILSSIPDALIVSNLNQELILANEKAESIFSFSAKDSYDKALKRLIQNDCFFEHLSQLKQAEHLTTEFEIQKDNKTFTYLMTSAHIKSETSQPSGYIYLLRDITKEKIIDKLQDGFLRTVSHELRTPLTSVIGFLELVMHYPKTKLDASQKGFLTTAHKEATNLNTLINDLLDLSQIQAGNTKMFYKKIVIKSLIDNIIESLTPLTKSKNLSLLNKMKHDSISIHADEQKLRRILVNLISNAIKFTEKGTISINCIEHDSHVEFVVEDTGIGIDEEHHDIIFQKFRQVDYSTSRQYEGIGLGLSIVKELVEMHGGTITVNSIPGKGAEFIFTIIKKPARSLKTLVT